MWSSGDRARRIEVGGDLRTMSTAEVRRQGERPSANRCSTACRAAFVRPLLAAARDLLDALDALSWKAARRGSDGADL